MTINAPSTAPTPTSAPLDQRPTRLIECPELARRAGIGRLFVKVEGERPLGSFKSLGGMLAGQRALARAAECADAVCLRLICASDGNHGLAVAAAAQRAGVPAAIYLPTSVSRARADRIAALDGEVRWIDGTYDDAVAIATAAAARGEGLLIADTSPDPDDMVVKDVMAGYGVLAAELVEQFDADKAARPTHLFVQAGVGGLAAAMAEGLQTILQPPGTILVVEPESAACVAAALTAGHPVQVPGDLHTSAHMLSCGLASAPALRILQRHRAQSVTVDEQALDAAVAIMIASGGPHTTPSGAAGLAGLLWIAAQAPLRARYRLGTDSIILLIATEGPVAEQKN
ncbi:pyridoxal-phosphate dependent enzyme [Sphingomonas lycopersici]|uniref:pyridoxal-phosphate dependent enzyme n=1 Tax=Sphingomonas lycopersici TaxID=2951807 RepID=UPI002237C001